MVEGLRCGSPRSCLITAHGAVSHCSTSSPRAFAPPQVLRFGGKSAGVVVGGKRRKALSDAEEEEEEEEDGIEKRGGRGGKKKKHANDL